MMVVVSLVSPGYSTASTSSSSPSFSVYTNCSSGDDTDPTLTLVSFESDCIISDYCTILQTLCNDN